MRLRELRLKNYRCLCDLTIPFPGFYSSICGKNNAGKTTLVRAMRQLFPIEHPFPFDPPNILTLKEDYPVWKRKEKISDIIEIGLLLEVNKVDDEGLHKFIGQFVKEATQDDLIVKLSYTRIDDSTPAKKGVYINEHSIEDYPGIEIWKKIQSSNAIIFYNSTEVDDFWNHRYRGEFGVVGNLTSADREAIDKMEQRIDKFAKKLARQRQKELTELVGKLEEKYSVGLSLPRFNFKFMPFEVSLGNRNFSVPLEDWGSGTRNRTQILLAILKAKKISETTEPSSKIKPVLVIEEPESFLHPSAQAEFGRVIQDLCEELQVQVITTTHSPYMLSLSNPQNNILLERRLERKQLVETTIIKTDGDDWMQPFAQTLGIDNVAFKPWRNLLFSSGKRVLLVEGNIDKEIFELLRMSEHGSKALKFDGEIVPYGGKDTLKNSILLKFVLGIFSKFYILYDRDCEGEVVGPLEALGLVKKKQFHAVGSTESGGDNIEGLMPERIKRKVYGDNSSLVGILMGGNSKERNEAKSRMKNYYSMPSRRKRSLARRILVNFIS